MTHVNLILGNRTNWSLVTSCHHWWPSKSYKYTLIKRGEKKCSAKKWWNDTLVLMRIMISDDDDGDGDIEFL